MAGDLTVRVIGLSLLLVGGLAVAQGSAPNDPTRPPASFLTPQATAADTAAGGGRLRSVKMTRPRHQSSALIDGQVVRLGEKIGESRLIGLTETSATLKADNGDKEVLYLTPDVTRKVLGKSARQRKKEML